MTAFALAGCPGPAANSGTGAIQNGDIGDSQTATTSTTVRIPADGTVSFFRRTSTESGWDFLRFSIDGTQVGSWSGTVAYSQVSFPLTAGTHTLTWSYTKDGSLSSGADTVYVDDIDVTVGGCGPTTVTFPSTTSTVRGGGALGAGGSGVFYQAGDFVEQTVTLIAPSSTLDLSLQMSDFTTGCATSETYSWNVIVDGATVGTYSFAGGTGVNPRTITGTYSLPVPASGATSIRLEATTTACGGGSSWNWIAGGTAIFR